MEYERQYEQYRLAVEEYLNGLFTGSAAYGRLYEAMRYSVLAGGKRIRPVLTLEFARLGGADWRTALPYACALELVHNYSLIHDDLPCGGANPPITRYTARRWRYWRATPCSRRRSG